MNDTKKTKKSTYALPFYTKSGEKKEDISLSFPREIKQSYYDLLRQYIYVFLTNQRKGTAHTKTRSEITGTTKKAYKQKGTGRARHGSEKAPIFVGGGVVGGPRKKYYHVSFSKKQKKIALLTSIYEKLKSGNMFCFENAIAQMKIKTKPALDLLKKLQLHENKILLISPNEKNSNIYYSMRNLPNVTITPVQNVNPYILLTHHTVIFFEETVSALQNIITKES